MNVARPVRHAPDIRQRLREVERELKENGQRFCDICNEEIPKRAKYQRSQMSAQAADLLRGSRDPDLIQPGPRMQMERFSWTFASPASYR